MDGKQWENRVVEGRFHLRQYLGGSGHSAVYLTESGEATPRKAAIKLVPADMARADAWMLRREFANRLSHPGLLSIYQFGTCRIDGAGLVYAVMEPGDEDLSQVIPTRPLTPVEAREMLLAVVEILEYVHSQGFVHGRLIPANIMAAGDRVKISSDGLLRAGESSGDLWVPDAGDPPESRGALTPAGDVWWLGMLLVEALTQRAPVWDRGGARDPAVPEALAAPFREIARRALRSDPRLRCSLKDFSLGLQPGRVEAEAHPRTAVPAAAAKPAAASASRPVARKRQYVLPLAGAILAGVLAAGAILAGLRWAGSRRPAESQPAVAPAPVAATVKPETVPAVARKPAAPAPTPARPAPTPAAPAPTPAPPTPRAAPPASGPASGDVVERFVPHAEYLETIHGAVSVRVRVKLDSSGAVVAAELDSRPSSPYFERLSVEAARRWKFKPPGGAGSTRLVRFEYHRDGCVASAE